jgi:hypothetical protein
MNAKTRRNISRYVRENIDQFHVNRTARIRSLKLTDVLRNKNPYLFRAKNLNSAADLITALLDARLSSSEEGTFGMFLEDLAIFVAETAGGGIKSAAEGIDVEVVRASVRYLIAIKSGKKWGNAGQHKNLRDNFRRALMVIKQSRHAGSLQPTLGICYGNFKTKDNGLYLHVGGQSFWHLISGDKQLYIDIIEPLGEEAEKHNEQFNIEKAAVYNRLIREFTITYCDAAGNIDWPKLVQFVSGNFNLPT